MRPVPLTPEGQQTISSKQLARLIMDILIRNDELSARERSWRVSYYPFALGSIRSFEIIGHGNPEVPEFARKWNEAIALLKSKAFIMLDPTQDDREAFMLPTSLATPEALDKELGPS